MKLTEQDAAAVDAALNAADFAGRFVPADADGGSGLAARVAKVDAMLKLLDCLPAAEPPADLVQRTLGRVEQARRGTADPAVSLPAPGAREPFRPAAGDGLRLSPARDDGTA